MTPELWQRAQALFHEALELPEVERLPWLEHVAESELRRLVQSMLATDARVNEHSVVPASSILQQVEQPELTIGEELGPYRIVSFLGAGGMGQVFRAERFDGVVNNLVAIKLLRQSASAAELRRRFAIERRILARLNHPGIARFIDAGADASGRPYVVMELIEGSAITAYVQTHQLGLHARLQLFLHVLEAVSYAHRQLIVHRDIKPGNVLVDETGVPHLLDFGIAKPLSDIDEALRADGATETAMRAFSLKYAAPEQLKGDPIGAGSDIYALGGLLYELLTDRPVFELSGLSMMKAQDIIISQMPVLPSARDFSKSSIPYSAKELKGDLDQIILHALKKEPQERYTTIDAFAADIRSYINKEPISLRSSVRVYQARKFVQRHKLAATLVFMLFGGLLFSSVTLFMQQQRWKAERDNALSQQKRAEQVTQLLIEAFEAADPSQNRGNEVKAREVLDQAARRLSDTELDTDSFVKLSVTVAKVYRSLGLVKEAEGLAEAAKSKLPHLVSNEVKVQLLHLLAGIYQDAGKMELRKASIIKASELVDALNLPELQIDQRILEISLSAQDKSSIQLIEQARELDQKTALRFGPTSELALKTGIYYMGQLSSIDRDKNAKILIDERLAGVSVDDMTPQHLELLLERINVDIDAGREAEAVKDIGKLKKATLRLFGANSMRYVSALSAEANVNTINNRYPEAKKITAQYMEILKQLYPETYPVHAIALFNLAGLERRMSEFENSKNSLIKAISIGEKVWGSQHNNVYLFKGSLAMTLSKQGEFVEAEKIVRSVLKGFEERQKGAITNTMVIYYKNLADILFSTGRKKESIELLEEILIRMNALGHEAYTRNQREEVIAMKNRFLNVVGNNEVGGVK